MKGENIMRKFLNKCENVLICLAFIHTIIVILNSITERKSH